jgi:hypothetical protein
MPLKYDRKEGKRLYCVNPVCSNLSHVLKDIIASQTNPMPGSCYTK